MRSRNSPAVYVLVVISLVPAFNPCRADDDKNDVLAGHSNHGEAFNEGPRQAAVLMEGMPQIEFPTSTKSEKAQAFFQQGVAQLHGFWYLEAERSFRQAAKEDPKLAIAYWGMALANTNNESRRRGFIDEAMKRRTKGADQREKLYIEALDRVVPKLKKDQNPAKDDSDDDDDKEAEKEAEKKRIVRYLADIEKIIHEYPDDLEARAFLAVEMWKADRKGVKLTSRYAVNALLGEVFASNPLHPAHHYRIHLWDSQRPQNSLESSARCGLSGPGIAHLWHMPGHIYSKLKRYGDAAWQQEASARVDHSHMIRTRLLPDQIHNFAHNNEWLIRNLLYVGRVDDALDQSRNLVSLPRHPTHNSLSKGGSFKYGRQRLLQTLSEYGLWQVLIREAKGPYLSPTDNPQQQEERLAWLSVAQFMTGNPKAGGRTLRSLQRRLLELQAQSLDLADAESAGETKSTDDADDDQQEEDAPTRDELKKHIAGLRKVIARAAAAAATHRKNLTKLKQHADTAKLNQLIRAQWLADAGDLAGAIKIAEKAARDGKSQVRPLAVLVDLLWRHNRKDEAKKQFESLRKVAGVADLDTPMLSRLKPVALAVGAKGDWRIAPQPAKDLGDRPPLEELGPFRWRPYQAPAWEATNPAGDTVASESFHGQPRIVIFYLGFGCLHCVEQLHAFSPELDAFKKQGIEVVAISSETVKELNTGIKNFDGKMHIPLLSDVGNQVFRAFRAWDDFEDQGLHGTFLIDAQNRARWQDIGHEPFTDVDFLIKESQRLLSLPIAEL